MDSESGSERRSEVSENRRIQRFNRIVGTWREKIARAREVGIAAGRNEPTRFARDEQFDENDAIKILKTTKSLLETLNTYHDQEFPRNQQGDIEYTVDTGTFRISSLTPNPDDPHTDHFPKLRVRMNTDGMNDIDVSVTTEGELNLKVFFDEANLPPYNSGKTQLFQTVTKEESFISEYVLENAQKAVEQKRSKST